MFAFGHCDEHHYSGLESSRIDSELHHWISLTVFGGSAKDTVGRSRLNLPDYKRTGCRYWSARRTV